MLFAARCSSFGLCAMVGSFVQDNIGIAATSTRAVVLVIIEVVDTFTVDLRVVVVIVG